MNYIQGSTFMIFNLSKISYKKNKRKKTDSCKFPYIIFDHRYLKGNPASESMSGPLGYIMLRLIFLLNSYH